MPLSHVANTATCIQVPVQQPFAQQHECVLPCYVHDTLQIEAAALCQDTDDVQPVSSQ